jgi:hypothetical protein
MSSEFPPDQNVATTTAVDSHVAEHRTGVERRARPRTERRTRGQRLAMFFGGAVNIGRYGRWAAWFATVVLIAAACWVYYAASVHKLFFKPGTGLGWYLGLVGGVMMLVMLVYPVRKHAKFAREWGAVRYWFKAHMWLGIVGPVLVLFHSTFHLKSLNATVAMYAMLLVAGSGLIGRFFYKHIHHGLYGRKATLDELQKDLDDNQKKVSNVDAVVIDSAGIGEKLKQYREMAFARDRALSYRALRFMTLGWQRRILLRQCRWELKRAVERLAEDVGWNKQQQKQHLKEAMLIVNEYLRVVQQTAQFASYESLFRLWHILHSPFVWLLAITGIVHVIAVYMY